MIRTPMTAGAEQSLVTLMLGEQLCGVPVQDVHDVLGDQPITPIPLASSEIAGCLNLRGRIVTVVDVRRRLGLLKPAGSTTRMSLVAERDGELYALLVDQVIEVVRVGDAGFGALPPTLAPQWIAYSTGICRLDEKLVVVLDVNRLLAVSGATI